MGFTAGGPARRTARYDLYVSAYLAGTLGVAIRGDLGLDSAALGMTISLFYAIGAVAMSFGGRVADRMGPRRALRTAAGMTGACLVGVALFGGTWAGLLACLVVGGIGSAIGAPIGTLLIVQHVAQRRRPIAFGLERSAIPASTLLASLALPLLATVLHWRLVFLVGALAVGVLVALRVPDAAPQAMREGCRAAAWAAHPDGPAAADHPVLRPGLDGRHRVEQLVRRLRRVARLLRRARPGWRSRAAAL